MIFIALTMPGLPVRLLIKWRLLPVPNGLQFIFIPLLFCVVYLTVVSIVVYAIGSLLLVVLLLRCERYFIYFISRSFEFAFLSFWLIVFVACSCYQVYHDSANLPVVYAWGYMDAIFLCLFDLAIFILDAISTIVDRRGRIAMLLIHFCFVFRLLYKNVVHANATLWPGVDINSIIPADIARNSQVLRLQALFNISLFFGNYLYGLIRFPGRLCQVKSRLRLECVVRFASIF
jgi:hypothetical protein